MFADGKMKHIKEKNTVSTVKHEDSVMFCGCFASGTGRLESLQGTMKAQDYQGILERNVQVMGLAIGQ